MKKILVLLFCFTLSHSISHASKMSKDSLSLKWAIGVIGSLDFYNYSFNNEEGIGIDLDHSYQARNPHYSSGITLTRKVNTVLSLTAGFLYSEKGFNRITNPAYYTGEWQTKEIKFYAYYIETPLLVKYDFLNKFHWSLGISTGSIINLPIRGTEHWIARAEDQNDKIVSNRDGGWKSYSILRTVTTNPPGRINASWLLSPSVSYKIKRLEFLFSPMYQYYFINIYKYRLAKKAQSFSTALTVNYYF